MKSKILSVLVGMAMIVAGVAFTSCGGDDDDDSPSGQATTASVQPALHVLEEMLNYYDVTVSIDGTTVTLTKDNTVSETKMGAEYRKFMPAATVYKTFPSTMTVVAHCTKKSNVQISDMDGSDYSMYMTVDYSNDNRDKVSTLNASSEYRYGAGLRYTKMDETMLNKFIDRTITGTFTMNSASSFSQSFVDTFK